MSLATEMITNGHNLIEPTEPPEPTIIEKRRDAIDQVVGTLAEDIMHEIGDLRKQLDALEQLVLSGAAKVSANLNEHVSICTSVREETAHLTDIIAELRERANAEPKQEQQ